MLSKKKTYLETLIFAIQTIDEGSGRKGLRILRRTIDCVLNHNRDFYSALTMAEAEADNEDKIRETKDGAVQLELQF
jgi:hypothetical protein